MLQLNDEKIYELCVIFYTAFLLEIVDQIWCLLMLEVRNLFVSVNGKLIIKNIEFKIKSGERHVIFGPNASGKTTLAKALMGIPVYKVDSGKILFEGKDITKLSVTEKAKLGMFLAYQSPPAIRGVKMGQLLRLLTKEEP